MIDESIIDYFKSMKSVTGLDTTKFLKYMSNNKVKYYNRHLIGPLALAALNGVYIDLNKLKYYHLSYVMFVILHESAHQKRIAKMGKAKVLESLSLPDFDSFFDHVIYEERVADRYGRMVFKKLNGYDFPITSTQQLDIPSNRESYRSVARILFGKVQNNEEKYDKLVNSFIDER